MRNDSIALFSLRETNARTHDFEEALQHSMRKYLLGNIHFMDKIPQEQLSTTLQKSIQVCRMAGENSVLHFKKIYVYDAELNTMKIDWRMTKKGLNLMIMQTPSVNEQMARWLWKLADL